MPRRGRRVECDLAPLRMLTALILQLRATAFSLGLALLLKVVACGAALDLVEHDRIEEHCRRVLADMDTEPATRPL